MKNILLMSLLCVYAQQTIAQTRSEERADYFTRVQMLNNKPDEAGTLLETGDTTITLRMLKRNDDSAMVNLDLNIPISQVNTIAVTRRTPVGRGMWIGATVGFGFGVMIGMMGGGHECSPNEFCFPYSAGEMALITGTLLAIPGMLIGILARGNTTWTITLGGNQDEYHKHRRKLAEYSLMYR